MLPPILISKNIKTNLNAKKYERHKRACEMHDNMNGIFATTLCVCVCVCSRLLGKQFMTYSNAKCKMRTMCLCWKT